ncbi:MAG: aminotransferase class I/II-fold pyridoxal phosphate-dependent enzyme, partial [Bacilli bacterium]
MKKETLLVHQNFKGDDQNSIVRQINTSTAYLFNDADHAAALFNLEATGNIYTRITNPNADALATLVSDLEGGIGGLCFASGQAALTAAITTIAQSGDYILVSNSLYGGTTALINNTLRAFGITPIFFNQDDSYEQIAALLSHDIKLVLVEAIANPNCRVIDFSKLTKLAQNFDFPIVVDSTFTPPTLFNPIEWGAHIIVHSATKYLGGHGNALAGIVVDSGKFKWNAPKFKCFNQPDPGCHGIIFNEHFGDAAFLARARTQILRDMGGALSPFNAYLISMGIQTLALRMNYI